MSLERDSFFIPIFCVLVCCFCYLETFFLPLLLLILSVLFFSFLFLMEHHVDDKFNIKEKKSVEFKVGGRVWSRGSI